MTKQWSLSPFDLFTLNMVIKGAWVYVDIPQADVLRNALSTLAATYPHLGGHYDETTKSIVWEDSAHATLPLEEISRREISLGELTSNKKIWSLVRPYDLNGFKKGKVKPFSATILHLKDGSILYVQCAHAAMDGNTFYTIVGQWAALCKGEPIQPLTVDQSLLPEKNALTKEETTRLVKEKGWLMIDAKKMIKMIWNLVRCNAIKDTFSMEVSQERIAELKKESGAGTNAVMCAIAIKSFAEHLPAREQLKLIIVADLRNRFPGIDGSFAGNFSQAMPIGEGYAVSDDLVALAKAIDNDVKTKLASEKPEENVRLGFCATNHSLPYFFFDASDMNCGKPGTIYVNNQLKFRACELDFGRGIPEKVLPNELTDMVKVWQPTAGGPIQLIFGGLAAKIMQKKR